MKRLFKKSFFIVLILVSFVGSSIQVKPAYAQAQQVGMGIVSLNLPDGWKYGKLLSIWGASANNVYAVGYGHNGSALRPLLYHKTGDNWTDVTLSLPSGWTSGYLYGIWGADANNVYAVGTGTGDLPLVQRWNGSTWAASTPTLPTGWSSGILTGVWGSGINDVYAVGYGYNTNTSSTMPLVFHWNGSAWSGSGPELPTGPITWNSGSLYGIWGSSVSNIYAVGSGSTNLPFVSRWNGVKWDPSSISLSGGWTSGDLRGIWGTAADNIYAVGYGNNGGKTVPMMHQWNGSIWNAISLPSLPTGMNAGYLSGIWGSSSSDVYAVGYGQMNNSTTYIPLLYHKDGTTTWTDSSPSMPTGWRSDYLYSVWGSSLSDVYAVGSGHNGSVDMPLLYHSSQVGQDLIAPGDVDQFAATSGASNGSVRLSWKAPTDDHNNPNSGPVTSYLVKYSGSPFASWDDGTPITSAIPTPTAPGTTQSMTVSGLIPGIQYYFAIRALDDQYNLSSQFATTNAIANVGNRLPGKVSLVEPLGSISATQPTYTWNVNDDATWYYLWVNGPSGTVIKQWYTSSQANCGTTCSIKPAVSLKAGSHTWWVQTWNEAGYGPWSDGMTFTAPTPVLPGKAILTLPTGSVGTNSPTYTWNEVPGSAWYYLWVNGPSGTTVIKQWYTSAQANCNGTTCSIANATPNLGGGSHTWWIQTWNEAGYGPWSDGMTFTAPTPVLPGKAILTLPTGSVGTNSPTYTWNEVPGSTWYYLWVNGPSGTVIRQWYTSAQANCNGTTCSITHSTVLSNGNHTWWIQTWSSAGFGPWSDGMSFSTP